MNLAAESPSPSSSGSDDFAAFLDAELEVASSNSSSDDDQADDDAEDELQQPRYLLVNLSFVSDTLIKQQAIATPSSRTVKTISPHIYNIIMLSCTSILIMDCQDGID